MDTENSYNEDTEIKGIITVPIAKSKSLVSKKTGEIVYFIDKNYGIKNKLMHKMNFSSIHPVHSNMCEITVPIVRVE
jgi:hypothetical protein